MKADRYQGFVFSPVDLAEEVDLDLDRRKEILFLHAHLAAWTHYQVFGLPRNAGAEEARQAYLERVKVFHPDRYAGKRLGSYRAKIDAIFRRLTEARDTLLDDARRAAYAEKTASPEERARMQARAIENELRQGERRARLARSNPIVARAGRIAELMTRGRGALAEGRFSQAANDFLLVAGLDPKNVEAKVLAAEAKKKAAAERGKEIAARADQAEAVGSFNSAVAFFLEAVETDPANPRYAVAAARCALKTGDLATARAQAHAAVRAAPRHAPAHEVLAQVLLADGQPKEAKRSLEKALECDPDLASARESLRKMRWSFLG